MNGMVGEPCAARPQLDGVRGEEPRAVAAGRPDAVTGHAVGRRLPERAHGMSGRIAQCAGVDCQ